MDVRRQFPLTLKHLGERAPRADTPAEFVRAVCDLHPRGDIPSRAVRDLARYEALLLELPQEAPAPQPGPLPAAPCRIAGCARLLVYGAALPEMLAALRAGRPPAPRPSSGWLLAWRGPDGAPVERWLAHTTGWRLSSLADAASPAEVLQDEDELAVAARLWEEGLIVRA